MTDLASGIFLAARSAGTMGTTKLSRLKCSRQSLDNNASVPINQSIAHVGFTIDRTRRESTVKISSVNVINHNLKSSLQVV